MSAVSRKHLLAAVVLAIILVIGLVYRFSLPRDTPAPRPVPLTTLAGSEASPSFSPDGNQVAFVWKEKGERTHVYIKLVGSTEVRQISPDETLDFAPSWSPDGRQIAFLRYSDAHEGRIHLMSALGGRDRKLSDFPVHGHVGWPGLSWSPNGQFLAAGRAAPFGSGRERGLYLIPTASGDPIRITHAPEPSYHHLPAFSPDGRQLAFASCPRPLSCEIAIVELPSELPTNLATVLPPRVIASPDLDVTGIAWVAHGRELVYTTVERTARGNLWRVSADGTTASERVEIAGSRASAPATVPGREFLAFARGSGHTDVYRFTIGRPAAPVLTSSADQLQPTFSPDGRRVAFISTRSGETADLWIANVDGSESELLIRGPGQILGSPRWSPDGRHIAFDCQGSDGHWHIWVGDADGGAPRQLTRGAGDQEEPSWSNDGRWLYFSANKDGVREIWRIRSVGDGQERLTSGWSGANAAESPDGTSLLYRPRIGEETPLLMRPLIGGPETTVVACVRAFTVAAAVYYVSCGQASEELHRRDLATQVDRLLGRLEEFGGTLAVSRDEQTVLYDRYIDQGADLWMIENFR